MFKPIGLYNEAEGKSHNQIINVPMGGGCCPGGDDEEGRRSNDISILRLIAPDLLFGEGSISTFYGLGSTVSPLGVVLMLEGEDVNKMGIYSDAGTGIGWDTGSASFTGGAGWYTGDIEHLSIKGSVEGERVAFDIGVKSFGDLSLLISVTAPDRYGGRIISVGISGGFSVPNPFLVGGSLNGGETFIHTQGDPTVVIPKLIEYFTE